MREAAWIRKGEPLGEEGKAEGEVGARVKGGRAAGAAVVVAIVATAAILRAPITSAGALSSCMQGELGLPSAAMGAMTTLPLLAFAASSLLVSGASARLGATRVLAFGCALVALGILVRSFCGSVGLFAGTLLLGIGISTGNVLTPAVVRSRFPASVGAMTALYTTCMSVFAGSAAGASSALAGQLLDWRVILLAMLPMALVALAFWAMLARSEVPSLASKAPAGRSGAGGSPLDPRLLKQPLTWWITGMFGLQSILFYCVVAWLPSMLLAAGVSQSAIAVCVMLFPIMGIPCTLALPPLAQRMRRQRCLGAVVGASCALGVALLLFVSSDAFAIAAVALLGFALGAPFCLCMFYFGAKTEDSADSSKLSSISQTFGYLLAAIGPAALGALFDMTQSWLAPIGVMVVLAVFLALCSWKSGEGSISAR